MKWREDRLGVAEGAESLADATWLAKYAGELNEDPKELVENLDREFLYP